MVLLEFFIDINLPVMGSTHPLREMSTRKIFSGEGFKGSWYIELTSLLPSYADCLEIWDPQLSETLRACTGLALPFALEIMSNGQLLCGLTVELAMSSTWTYNYYPCPLDELTPEHCTKYYDLPAVCILTDR